MGYQSIAISWYKKNVYEYNFKLHTGKSIHTLLWTVPLMLLWKEKDGSAEKGLGHWLVMELYHFSLT